VDIHSEARPLFDRRHARVVEVFWAWGLRHSFEQFDLHFSVLPDIKSHELGQIELVFAIVAEDDDRIGAQVAV
jgi:hypothetical protein